MAVLKHFSIKNSPLATLKYIVGETKEHKAAIVTGLKCSEDPESAYMEMAMCYEHFAGDKFHRVGNPTGKEHLKMHHYVISFKGWEVTPQEAHRIAEQWAKEIFGDNHQVLIATHADTKNIHVHLAANAFNMDGKRWLDNKKTLNLCKEKINKLCWLKNLSVIENPKWNANQNYAEWLARQNGTSWKQKLCDDIDRIVLMENVRNIDDLVKQLCNCGYFVRQGKYLSVRPANLDNRKPVRTLKLGDGYGLEELKYRIENKDKEMSLDKVLTYTGIQREYALCLRQIQMILYRKPEENPKVTYNEVRRSAELLCYIHEHNIHSKEDFEKHVNKIAEKTDYIVRNYNEDKRIIKDYEFIVENADRYFELLNADPPTPNHKLSPYKLFFQLNIDSKEKVKFYVNHLEKMKSEFAETQDKYDRAVAEKKEVTAHYSTFIRQTETDYARYLTSGKKELEEYEESLQKAALEEQRKAEEERERAERQIAEKRMAIEEARQREEAKKRAEERRKRNSNCR